MCNRRFISGVNNAPIEREAWHKHTSPLVNPQMLQADIGGQRHPHTVSANQKKGGKESTYAVTSVGFDTHERIFLKFLLLQSPLEARGVFRAGENKLFLWFALFDKGSGV